MDYKTKMMFVSKDFGNFNFQTLLKSFAFSIDLYNVFDIF